ncbi:MAG: ribbon-helix-helix protein, CopG family [Nitrososphaeria archaeon]
MRRKSWVKVYLSKEQKHLLERIAKSLGIGESEVLRQAFMEYAKSISLITEKVHTK